MNARTCSFENIQEGLSMPNTLTEKNFESQNVRTYTGMQIAISCPFLDRNHHIIRIGWIPGFSALEKFIFGGIKNMAVDCLLFEHWEPKKGFMEHLQKLYVVVPDDEPDVDWEGAKEVFTDAVRRGKEEGYEGASENFALVRVQNLEEFGEAIKFTPSLVNSH